MESTICSKYSGHCPKILYLSSYVLVKTLKIRHFNDSMVYPPDSMVYPPDGMVYPPDIRVLQQYLSVFFRILQGGAKPLPP